MCVFVCVLRFADFEAWDGYKSTPAWASRDHCLPGIGLLGAWPAGHPCGAQLLGYPKGGFSDFAGAAAGTKAHGAGPFGLPLPWLAPPGQGGQTVAVGRVRLLSANPSRSTRGFSALHTPTVVWRGQTSVTSLRKTKVMRITVLHIVHDFGLSIQVVMCTVI